MFIKIVFKAKESTINVKEDIDKFLGEGNYYLVDSNILNETIAYVYTKEQTGFNKYFDIAMNEKNNTNSKYSLNISICTNVPKNVEMALNPKKQLKVENKGYRLFVGQVSVKYENKYIAVLFSKYGKVLGIHRSENLKRKGCCFVIMDSEEACNFAVEDIKKIRPDSGCRNPITAEKAEKNFSITLPLSSLSYYIPSMDIYSKNNLPLSSLVYTPTMDRYRKNNSAIINVNGSAAAAAAACTVSTSKDGVSISSADISLVNNKPLDEAIEILSKINNNKINDSKLEEIDACSKSEKELFFLGGIHWPCEKTDLELLDEVCYMLRVLVDDTISFDDIILHKAHVGRHARSLNFSVNESCYSKADELHGKTWESLCKEGKSLRVVRANSIATRLIDFPISKNIKNWPKVSKDLREVIKITSSFQIFTGSNLERDVSSFAFKLKINRQDFQPEQENNSCILYVCIDEDYPISGPVIHVAIPSGFYPNLDCMVLESRASHWPGEDVNLHRCMPYTLWSENDSILSMVESLQKVFSKDWPIAEEAIIEEQKNSQNEFASVLHPGW